MLSAIAPFIADDASSAGATNTAYGTVLPAVGGDVADERAEADADREQVEHRLDEAAEQQQPGPAEGGHVALTT